MQTKKLPCRHIFNCRSDFNLSLIEPQMLNACTNSLLNDQEIDATSESECIRTIPNLNKHKKGRSMTVKDKYNMAWAPIKELASALSHLNDEEFDEQFTTILEIKTLIENRMKFKLSYKDSEEEFASTSTLDANTTNTEAVINPQSTIATESVILYTVDVADTVKSVDMSNLNLLKVSTIGAKKKVNKKKTFNNAQTDLTLIQR
jgi:hypothetical protein